MTRRSDNSKSAGTHDASKRDFVRKAVYVAPAILSMQAYSALAKAGSIKDPRADAQKKLCEAENRVRSRLKKPLKKC